MPLQSNHRHYLESRDFDPDLLEREWNLLGTGPYSVLDHINYKHRIIIPFFWDGEEVSFDSRDITDKDPGRYKACPKDRELIPHKNILYGKQSQWKDTGICVEGPTDVWRLGVHSFATSGIKYTSKQVRLMSKSFKRIWVMFDNDPQAIIQAKKLTAELRFRGVEAMLIESIIASDPGSMKQKDANYLIKQLIT
jgi:DNA primase